MQKALFIATRLCYLGVRVSHAARNKTSTLKFRRRACEALVKCALLSIQRHDVRPGPRAGSVRRQLDGTK